MSNHHVQQKLLFNLLQLLGAKARAQKFFLPADFHGLYALQLAQIFKVQTKKNSGLKNVKF